MDISNLVLWKEQGLTLREISELTNIHYYTLRSRYIAAGIQYNYSNNWDISRVINSNDIDGQYIIGLLAADGYLSTDSKRIEIFLQECDIELIRRILYTLNNQEATIHSKTTVTGTKHYGILIGKIELVNYLSLNYGFQKQKSRTLPFPRHLSNPLPFLRGFFDGDGYIGQACTFTIGSHNFANGLLEWIYNNYGYTPNVQMIGMNKDVFNIHFRKNMSCLFVIYLVTQD